MDEDNPCQTSQSDVVEEVVAREVAREKERLYLEAGLPLEPVKHFKRPKERTFSRHERDKVTLLFGGATQCHERLIQAGVEGLGYNVEILPCPSKPDFQAGREYGNNGQCNPTYFTTGMLVNHLKRLRDEEGMAVEDILKNYAFITAGACGPCRFGMYEAEYRLALRNSGFDGFRVLVFQQEGGMDQSAQEVGLDLNARFFVALLNGFIIGDLLNELKYQIRPYETEAGATDNAFEQLITKLAGRMRAHSHDGTAYARTSSLLARLFNGVTEKTAQTILTQLFDEEYLAVLREGAALIDETVEVDYTRPKPLVKVTGEFWAQTTEGDGNFRMFSFLESQGAEVLVEPVTTWLQYLLAQMSSRMRDQRNLPGSQSSGGVTAKIGRDINYHLGRLKLKLASKILDREYDRIRAALGGTTHGQINQLELQRVGHPYYNRKSSGGEGHLEVAKNIYYANKNLAHMVLSLKPFGCMPSTQSDGAQAAVTSHFSDMIYIPIETSGEGDVNAHSRVQMALGEAKAKCKEEFKSCVEQTGYTLEEIRRFCMENPEYRRPIQEVPHHEGSVGKAANFVLSVAEIMDADPVWSARKHVQTAPAVAMTGVK